MYAQLRLTDHEQSVITLEDVVDDEAEDKANMSLVGKLFTRKPYNLIHMKNALVSAWRLAKGFNLKDIGDNLFVCEFYSKSDRSRILREGPWHFDKQLILFEPLSGNMQPNNILMSTCPVWVRIYDLPMNCRGQAAITKIGAKVGRVLEWDDNGGGGWCRFGRVRVAIDVTKPLTRGSKIVNSLGEQCWISFKYERIHNFCYWCGMLDHMVADCELKPDEVDVSDWPYGPFLRATPRKRSMMGQRSYINENHKDMSGLDGTSPPSVIPEQMTPVRRVLNMTEVRREVADKVLPNLQQQNGCLNQGGVNASHILNTGEGASLDTDGFIDITVVQVQSSNHIASVSGSKTTVNGGGKKGGTTGKRATWNRNKSLRSEGTTCNEELQLVGATKRTRAMLQNTSDSDNLFSKKLRDGLSNQFENIEISAETAGQSRRMQ
ncbi:uncharacterized protein LOC126687827 [Mercurialis annua]|uniref:uncharacterized protein LOC126687827 n=1 Tax=Mercurialis annua TaxID=3986 RepID=UPI00215F3916|nr:uncharacterized protein LOC126687827 [Mercurialis annua]